MLLESGNEATISCQSGGRRELKISRDSRCVMPSAMYYFVADKQLKYVRYSTDVCIRTAVIWKIWKLSVVAENRNLNFNCRKLERKKSISRLTSRFFKKISPFP